MWSIGCIFYELTHARHLFHGQTEISLLFDVFKMFGTPNESIWQGSKDLPYLGVNFPKWKVNGNEKLIEICSQFTEHNVEIDLLTQMLQLEPSKRVTIKGALEHPFFHDLNCSTLR